MQYRPRDTNKTNYIS